MAPSFLLKTNTPRGATEREASLNPRGGAAGEPGDVPALVTPAAVYWTYALA
jgi:hypothetical protein